MNEYEINYDPHPISTMIQKGIITDGPHRINSTASIEVICIDIASTTKQSFKYP